MGIFDRLKKSKPTLEQIENTPDLLTAKLLFVQKPEINAEGIQRQLELYFSRLDSQIGDKALSYFFPDYAIEFKDSTISGQCTIFIPNESDHRVKIPEEAFQQNWHWIEANDTAKQCDYEILVSDLMTRTLEYKQRLDLFMRFLVSVTKATNPQAIFSGNSQKLIEPSSLIESWDGPAREILFGIVNVRLFTISNGDSGQIVMDTVGLSSLGLPDFQLVHEAGNESYIAQLLWNYAYYNFEHGNVIKNGHTLLGLEPNSKWECKRQMSIAKPERIVINVQPSPATDSILKRPENLEQMGMYK